MRYMGFADTYLLFSGVLAKT